MDIMQMVAKENKPVVPDIINQHVVVEELAGPLLRSLVVFSLPDIPTCQTVTAVAHHSLDKGTENER